MKKDGITIKIVIKFDQYFKSLNLYSYRMSLSTSKSKTQLAYASINVYLQSIGSTKPVTKPKSKNSSMVETGDSGKSRTGPRNSTGNIYDTIMRQIEPKQQDYIKSLIVKNEKEAIKQEKQMNGEKQGDNALNFSNKNQSKKSLNSSMIIVSPTQGSILKVNKQGEVPAKKQVGVHERTRSQAELIVKDSGVITSSIETTKSNVQPFAQEKQVTQISCNSSQGQQDNFGKGSKVQVIKKNNNSKQKLFRLSQSATSNYTLSKAPTPCNKDIPKPLNTTTCHQKNPIIEALNNTSTSFLKKLEMFQLQYPEEREQRSTHNKMPSKLSVEYFSAQTSPKNGGKNVYTKEIVVKTKAGNGNSRKYGQEVQGEYRGGNNNNNNNNNRQAHQYQPHPQPQQPTPTTLSPISTTKHSNSKPHNKRPLQAQPTIATSFISCLDEYLEALTYDGNGVESVGGNGARLSHNMKKQRGKKFKEFSASKGQPFILGEEEDEEGEKEGYEEEQQETVLLGNLPYGNNNSNNKTSKLKLQNTLHNLLTLPQHQNLLKQLSQQRKKVQQLNSIIQMFHQQLTKYKKKHKKLKQIQYSMLQAMKDMNDELTNERNQRRKLEGVVGEFELKIRGISRGKEKVRRDSHDERDTRPQRKTIYEVSSSINNFPKHQYKNSSSKLQKHSKKPSFNNRFSSMINSVNNNDYYLQEGQEYDGGFGNGQNGSGGYCCGKNLEEGFFKNKTQKFSKIISTFQLENQPYDEEEEMYFRSRNFGHGNGRKSNNDRHVVMRDSLKHSGYPQPSSCKNSYMNSSMPINLKSKSRPMTPKLVEQLFRSTKKSKNADYQTKNYSSSQESYQETSREYTKEHFDEDREFESESEVRPTEMSADDGEVYCQEVMKRMR